MSVSVRRKISSLNSSEASLVAALADMLRNEGYKVKTEVSNMGQSVDVVAIRGRWVTAIEAKLRNWKKALMQCHSHEQVADYICVAIATSVVPNDLLTHARNYGYGIIHWIPDTGKIAWITRPRLNRRVWMPQRRHWSRAMKGIAPCQSAIG